MSDFGYDPYGNRYIIEQLIDSKVPPSKICFELQEAAVIAHLADADSPYKPMRLY